MVDLKKLIIVAEDEPLTRMLTAELLEDAGYEVMEAAHADEALAILKSQAGRVRLLFTDIHMPGTMDGLELAHIVREHWPKVALIIASNEHTPELNELPEGGIFVSKPYDLEKVISQIDTLITA